MQTVVIRYINNLIATQQINVNSEGIDLLETHYSEALQQCIRSWLRLSSNKLQTIDGIYLNFIEQYENRIQIESKTLTDEIFAINYIGVNSITNARLSRLKTKAAKVLWITKQMTTQQFYEAFIEDFKCCNELPALNVTKAKFFNELIATGHEVFTNIQEIHSLCTEYFNEVVKALHTDEVSEEFLHTINIFRNNYIFLCHLVDDKNKDD